MKHIVTGGTGFIGSALVERLLRDGCEVVVIDNGSSPESILQESLPYEFKEPQLTILRGDISYIKTQTDLHSKLVKAFEGVDTVFHLAARARVQPSIEEPVFFNATNVEGTLNMLEYSRHAGVRRFVFTSSSSIYGDVETFPTPETSPKIPLSPYGLQKLIGEQYCQLYSRIHGLETVCLRYFNVYGDHFPSSGAYCLVMGNFLKRIHDQKNLQIYGDGEQRRDFTFLGDVIEANILASKSDKVGAGEGINIGNGDNRSINDIAKPFLEYSHKVEIGDSRPFKDLEIEYLPERVEPRITLADNSLAKELLGWTPKGNLETWLDDYLNYWVYSYQHYATVA
jgi:UDP-glucose 4-epimerase